MFYTETYCPGVADFDRDGKLAYEAILRILENTASRHSDSSGDDVIDGSRRGITWVLTDWRVEIVRRPQSKAPCRSRLGCATMPPWDAFSAITRSRTRAERSSCAPNRG